MNFFSSSHEQTCRSTLHLTHLMHKKRKQTRSWIEKTPEQLCKSFNIKIGYKRNFKLAEIQNNTRRKNEYRCACKCQQTFRTQCAQFMLHLRSEHRPETNTIEHVSRRKYRLNLPLRSDLRHVLIRTKCRPFVQMHSNQHAG